MQWGMDTAKKTDRCLPKRALVLFSGGLDSTTVLYVARSRGFEPLAQIFSYGQRHAVEVDRALRSVKRLGIPFCLETLDLRAVGGSALTSDEIDVPRSRSENMRAAQGRLLAVTTVTATSSSRITPGTLPTVRTGLTQLAQRNRTITDCLTCTAMSGPGVTTLTGTTTSRRRKTFLTFRRW